MPTVGVEILQRADRGLDAEQTHTPATPTRSPVPPPLQSFLLTHAPPTYVPHVHQDVVPRKAHGSDGHALQDGPVNGDPDQKSGSQPRGCPKCLQRGVERALLT